MNIIEEILRLPDMTGVIKARKRPVLLYGMGNGAELTDAYLRSRGIIPDGVFASDGFVRGQSFMGKRVLSVAEAEHLYGDFTAVLSFVKNVPPPTILPKITFLSARRSAPSAALTTRIL